MASPDQILASFEQFFAPLTEAAMAIAGGLAWAVFIFGIGALLGVFDAKGERK